MISLNRLTMPQELADWLQQSQQQFDTLRVTHADIPESLSNRYRDKEVKAHLLRETQEKCAYCESRMLAVAFGDVEHLLPKSKFPGLRLTHDNLTIVCSRCNTAKSDYHDPEVPLLNPFRDNPSEHLLLLGANIGYLSDRGLVAIDRNRSRG